MKYFVYALLLTLPLVISIYSYYRYNQIIYVDPAVATNIEDTTLYKLVYYIPTSNFTYAYNEDTSQLLIKKSSGDVVSLDLSRMDSKAREVFLFNWQRDEISPQQFNLTPNEFCKYLGIAMNVSYFDYTDVNEINKLSINPRDPGPFSQITCVTEIPSRAEVQTL